jgi:acyl dehydratase
MGILATVAAEEAGGAERLRRISVRFAGMVEPGDTVTFAAGRTAGARLELSALNQKGEAVLTRASAEITT